MRSTSAIGIYIGHSTSAVGCYDAVRKRYDAVCISEDGDPDTHTLLNQPVYSLRSGVLRCGESSKVLDDDDRLLHCDPLSVLRDEDAVLPPSVAREKPIECVWRALRQGVIGASAGENLPVFLALPPTEPPDVSDKVMQAARREGLTIAADDDPDTNKVLPASAAMMLGYAEANPEGLPAGRILHVHAGGKTCYVEQWQRLDDRDAFVLELLGRRELLQAPGSTLAYGILRKLKSDRVCSFTAHKDADGITSAHATAAKWAYAFEILRMLSRQQPVIQVPAPPRGIDACIRVRQRTYKRQELLDEAAGDVARGLEDALRPGDLRSEVVLCSGQLFSLAPLLKAVANATRPTPVHLHHHYIPRGSAVYGLIMQGTPGLPWKKVRVNQHGYAGVVLDDAGSVDPLLMLDPRQEWTAVRSYKIEGDGELGNIDVMVGNLLDGDGVTRQSVRVNGDSCPNDIVVEMQGNAQRIKVRLLANKHVVTPWTEILRPREQQGRKDHI
jgi:hypothetical protein